MVALRALLYVLGIASLIACVVAVRLHEALPAVVLFLAGVVILVVTFFSHVRILTKSQGDKNGT